MNDTHRRLVCNRLIVQYVIDSCGVVRLFMLKVMMQSLLAVLAHIVAYMVIIFAAAECQIRSWDRRRQEGYAYKDEDKNGHVIE